MVLIGVAVAVSALAFVAAPVSEFGVGWPLPWKALVTVCLIAPAGFLMGIPFPTGLTRLEQQFPHAVRWAWALNAAASVLGSVSAICLAIYIGLRATVLMGALLYVCALAVVSLRNSTQFQSLRRSRLKFVLMKNSGCSRDSAFLLHRFRGALARTA